MLNMKERNICLKKTTKNCYLEGVGKLKCDVVLVRGGGLSFCDVV